jgi:hypothetical protein
VILTTKSTKITKNQSTEDTEQTESLADVGRDADEFVSKEYVKRKKHRGGLRLLGGFDALRVVKMTCGEKMSKKM